MSEKSIQWYLNKGFEVQAIYNLTEYSWEEIVKVREKEEVFKND